METCVNCGATLAPTWKFCVYCGAPTPENVAENAAENIPGAIRPDAAPAPGPAPRLSQRTLIIAGAAIFVLGIALLVAAIVVLSGGL